MEKIWVHKNKIYPLTKKQSILSSIGLCLLINFSYSNSSNWANNDFIHSTKNTFSDSEDYKFDTKDIFVIEKNKQNYFWQQQDMGSDNRQIDNPTDNICEDLTEPIEEFHHALDSFLDTILAQEYFLNFEKDTLQSLLTNIISTVLHVDNNKFVFFNQPSTVWKEQEILSWIDQIKTHLLEQNPGRIKSKIITSRPLLRILSNKVIESMYDNIIKKYNFHYKSDLLDITSLEAGSKAEKEKFQQDLRSVIRLY